MNERKTEDLVEALLRQHGYYASNGDLIVEKQQSDSARVAKILKGASKSGSGVGRPEFIIRSRNRSQFLIVIECKADTRQHRSLTRHQYKTHAVDGVLLYAEHLAKEFDVLAIAVSGQNESCFRLSHFLHLNRETTSCEWNVANTILPFDDYYNAFLTSDIKFKQDYNSLLDYSRRLNDHLQSHKITEAYRAFLISGILIALKNQAFCAGFRAHRKTKQLVDALFQTIDVEFDNAGIPSTKRNTLLQSFSFLQTLPTDKEFLINLIDEIDENINAFLRTHKYYDVIGQFYVEFLRYANNDKGLGIVLTPPHIAELFSLLAGVHKASVVFDNCCGTAGLLVAAMKVMMLGAGADNALQIEIKRNQLFGIEYQPTIYALAVCNMILHDDGKANIDQGDCFSSGMKTQKREGVKLPNVGLLNPPYKNKRMSTDKEELMFILNNMEYLDPHTDSRCIAIVPITCATNPSGVIGELKRQLLSKHTLEAVMSMPIELFHNSRTTVVTCIMVFTAHRPHPPHKKTWFGYWRDDGFVKTKHRGRVDLYGKWQAIRETWVESFLNRDVIPNMSVTRKITHDDEWCAEAYLTPDYSLIDRSALIEMTRMDVLNQIVNGMKGE